MASYTTTIFAQPTTHKVHALGQSAKPTDGLHTLPSATVPDMQHAVVTPKIGPDLNLQYSKVAVCRPEPGEVTVKMTCTGVCRSDLSFSKGMLPGFKQHNHIAGHEGIGHVVASHDPALLGRVVAARYVASTCRTCWACLRNIPDACKSQKNFPKHHDGTFQEYMTAPWTSLMPLDAAFQESDNSMDPTLYTAALCSGAAALKALRGSNLLPDDVVLIFGIAGGIGHLAGMMAKRIFGACVIGVDKAAKEHAFPGNTGQGIFDIFVAAPETPEDSAGFADRIYESTRVLRGGFSEPKQPDAMIIAASSEEPFQWVNLIRDNGTVSCLSVLTSTGTLSVRIAELVERQIRIQGVMMGGWEESYQVLQYIRDKRIEPIVTKVALQELPEAIGKMCQDAFVGKLVVVMEDSVTQP